MWIEKDEWIDEKKGIMDIKRGFSLLEIFKLRIAVFALSAPLDFLGSFLRAKCELVVKRGDALDLSSALNELSQSSTFFFKVFFSSFCINFPPKYLKFSSFESY
ncbi:hypothetical protein HKD37_12G033248 [Glycine soja]